MTTKPIVYTIPGCSACVQLLNKWNEEGIEYEERRADLDQSKLPHSLKTKAVLAAPSNTHSCPINFKTLP